MTQIRLEQVSFAPVRPAAKSKKGSFAAYYLLRGLSFEIASGDRVALVGASGAGKTTLLRLLNRLIDPIEGVIYFEGRAFKDIPISELRQQILYVSQEPKLLGMTVREALKYPLTLRKVQDLDQRVNKWIERLRIPREWLDQTELQLSTGERQWVAIARALLCETPVLLLDEPTAHLDAGRSDRLLEILRETRQTVLTATQDLAWAEQFSDRVLHLQRGALVQDSDRVNWQELRAAIAQIEVEESAEWD